MASQLRSDTSKINGAKSHGPKSAETRAISSQNALKHGCTAHHTLLLACEDPDEFQRVLDDYSADYRPTNSTERRLVEEMFGAFWRIRRLKSMETALLNYEMLRQGPELEKNLATFDVAIQLAVSFATLADGSRALSLIIRYESALHRLHERALNALLAMRRSAKAPQPELTLAPPQPIRPAEIKTDETNPGPVMEPVPEPSN